MQTDSSRIWTRIAVSIYYDGNRYTTGTSIVESKNQIIGDKLKFIIKSPLQNKLINK